MSQPYVEDHIPLANRPEIVEELGKFRYGWEIVVVKIIICVLIGTLPHGASSVDWNNILMVEGTSTIIEGMACLGLISAGKVG